MGDRQRRRGDGADDRGRLELAPLAAGTVIEGKRWLDDAFACAGEADERTRALALTGRGLLDFLAGAREHSDEDLEAALEIFFATTTSSRPRWRTRSTPSYRRPRRHRRGSPAPAEPARLLRRVSGRSLRRRCTVVLAGEARDPRRRPRASRTALPRRSGGLRPVDRPVMLSMSLGMIADFDERAGDFRPRSALGRSDRDERRVRLRGFTGSLHARLGWALLEKATSRAPSRPTSARSMPRRGCALRRSCSSLSPDWPCCTGSTARPRRGRRGRRGVGDLPGRRSSPVPEPRRPRRRLQSRPPPAASSSLCLAAEGDAERAAALLGQAERLRAEAGAEIPFQLDDVERARRAASAALGADAFAAAFERGRSSAQAAPAPESAPSAQRGARSAAPGWCVVPQAAGPIQEDP